MFWLAVALIQAPTVEWAGLQFTTPAIAAELRQDVAEGQRRVATFFGAPFLESLKVQVLPHRADFDGVLKDKWGMPASERWMVAAGGADTLAILDPGVWKKEAAEHDPDKPREIQLLITHELVHVYMLSTIPAKTSPGWMTWRGLWRDSPPTLPGSSP